MYIIEKIVKLYSKFINKEKINPVITDENGFELEDILTCSHIFMPVDSTKKLFACTKCGYLISKSRLEKKKDNHK